MTHLHNGYMSLVWDQGSKSDKLLMLKINPKKLPDHNPFCFVNSLLKGRKMMSVFTSLGAVEKIGKYGLTFRWRRARLIFVVTLHIKPISDGSPKKQKFVLRCWLKVPKYAGIVRARST